MSKIRVLGFAHVGIRVHDLDRSLAFYALLGFTKTMGPVGPEPVAILHHPTGVEINLILNAPSSDATNVLMDVPVKQPGYTHLALEVADVAEAADALESAGFPITERMTIPGKMKAVFVRDPDRNVIELDEPFAS
ncbi:MAG: VOC family protein [Proteobacteria bacterium]|nr:VOC family protein [Pseudomonadota bacterium]